jgi:hypothetical protein
MPAFDPDDITTWPPEWLPFITLPKVEEITTLSPDTVTREYRHLLVQLSPRRVAMRLGHALTLGRRLGGASVED